MSDYALYIDGEGFAVEVSYDRYEIIISDGASPRDVWQKKTIYIDTADTYQSEFFAGEIGDMLFIGEQPKLWANEGVSLGEIIKTDDTLDFTAIGGITAFLHFEYRRLP